MCRLKVRFSQSSQRRGVFNYALKVEVTDATGIPSKIFVYHQSPAGTDGNTFAEFDHIATPVDFQEIPEDAASETVPWYRTDKCVAWFRCVSDLVLAKQLFVDDINALTRTYNVLTSENGFRRQTSVEFSENGVYSTDIPEEDAIQKEIDEMKKDISGKISKDAMSGVNLETNTPEGIRSAVQEIGNTLGARIVKTVVLALSVLSIGASALGAGFSGEHVNQIDYDENPVIVTNVTFDGLATLVDITNIVDDISTNFVPALQKEIADASEAGTNYVDSATNDVLSAAGDYTDSRVNNVSNELATTIQPLLDIPELIPVEAAPTNQLADKAWVDDKVESVAAYYITADAEGNAFESYAALTNTTVYYSGGVVRVPTRNDYAVVLADETHGGTEWRYIYAMPDGATTGQWEAQYPIETNDYEALSNKPQLNGHTLTNNQTGADLGLLDLAGGAMTGILSAAHIMLDGGPITGALEGRPQLNGSTLLLKHGADSVIISLDASGFYIVNGHSEYFFPVESGTLALLQNVASNYSDSADYAINQLCVQDGVLKRCTTAGTGSAATFENATIEYVLNVLRTNKVDISVFNEATTLNPVYDGNGKPFSDWVCVPATYEGSPITIEQTESPDAGMAVYTPCTNGVAIGRAGTASKDVLSLRWRQGAASLIDISATRTENKFLGYALGSQTNKVLASEAEAEALRTGKASTADATLTERSPTPWVCVPAEVEWYGIMKPVDTPYWDDDERAWYVDAVAGGIQRLSTDQNATTLTYHSWGATVIATRTVLQGYQLGSQSDKPLASEAEAEALRTGKQDALSAQQLANIAAVSDALTFDATHSYAAGDPVVYNGTLYTFTTTHTGAWTGNDVSAVDIIAMLAGKVPTSRTVNGKALSSDVTLTAGDIDYSVSGGSQSVQITLEVIDAALAGKASTADATLNISASPWTCSPSTIDVETETGIVTKSVTIVPRYSGTVLIGWVPATDGTPNGTTKGDAFSSNLIWEANSDWIGSVNLTATREVSNGMVLGSQTDKPLASEAEVWKLRNTTVKQVQLSNASPGTAPISPVDGLVTLPVSNSATSSSDTTLATSKAVKTVNDAKLDKSDVVSPSTYDSDIGKAADAKATGDALAGKLDKSGGEMTGMIYGIRVNSDNNRTISLARISLAPAGINRKGAGKLGVCISLQDAKEASLYIDDDGKVYINTPNGYVEVPDATNGGTLALTAGTGHNGNLAALDANGNPTDSGRKPSDFVLKNAAPVTIGDGVAAGTAGSIVAIGQAAKANAANATSIGHNAEANGLRTVAIGSSDVMAERTAALANYSVAIGGNAIANATSAVQIGSGTNSVAKSLKFRNTTVVGDNGKIPSDSLEASLVGESMPANPTQNELAEAVKKIFTALGGTVTP